MRPWARFESASQPASLLTAAATAAAEEKAADAGRASDSNSPFIVNIREDEAAACLERLATERPDGIGGVDVRRNLNGVLELVYKEMRPSRWALGKEAAGVLRKLFTQAPTTQTASGTPAATRPSTPTKEPGQPAGATRGNATPSAARSGAPTPSVVASNGAVAGEGRSVQPSPRRAGILTNATTSQSHGQGQGQQG